MVTQALWVLLVLVGGGAAAPFLHSHPLHPALTMKRFVDFGTKSSNSWQPNTGVSTSLISSSSLLQSSPLIKSSPLIPSSPLQRSLPSSTPAALQRLQRTNSLEWEVRLHP